MIQGAIKNKRTEKEYRALDIDSSSTLKTFYDSPFKYFEKYILGEDDKKESRDALIGSLVHTILLEGQEAVDQKYYQSTVEEAPGDKMLDFCNALFKHTKLNCTEDGEVTVSMEYLLQEAHKDSGFKWGLERVVKEFTGKLPELYYNEIREAWGQKKQIVTIKDIAIAESIANHVRQDEVAGPIFNAESTENVEIYNELQGDDLEIDGLALKYMIDKLEIDHLEKTVQGNDLKVTWDPHRFYNEYYLTRKSFIQAYVYTKGIDSLIKRLYPGYIQKPFRFIAVDSTSKQQSIIYQVYPNDLQDAYHGFYERGWYYRGVGELIYDLIWHKGTGIWCTSREAFENNGILPLKIQRA